MVCVPSFLTHWERKKQVRGKTLNYFIDIMVCVPSLLKHSEREKQVIGKTLSYFIEIMVCVPSLFKHLQVKERSKLEERHWVLHWDCALKTLTAWRKKQVRGNTVIYFGRYIHYHTVYLPSSTRATRTWRVTQDRNTSVKPCRRVARNLTQVCQQVAPKVLNAIIREPSARGSGRVLLLPLPDQTNACNVFADPSPHR